MEKVVNIINKSDEAEENIQYWNSRTTDERLSTIQVLREQYISLFNKQDSYDESRKRLRRVYRVIKRSES